MPHKIFVEATPMIMESNPSDETTENDQITFPILESVNDASPHDSQSDTPNCETRCETNSSPVVIVEPNDSDVLCGRGGNVNMHPGNIYFRKLVDSRKPAYITARFKREKRMIAESILNDIKRTNGRFLAKNNTGKWVIYPDHKARDKTSQALREDAPKIRAKLQSTMDDRSSGALMKNSMMPPKDPACTSHHHHQQQHPMSYFCYKPNTEYLGQYRQYFDQLCGVPFNKNDSREDVCEEAPRDGNSLNHCDNGYEDYEDSFPNSNDHTKGLESYPTRNSRHRMPPRDEKPIGTNDFMSTVPSDIDSLRSSNDVEMLALRDSLSIDHIFNDSERTPAPTDIEMDPSLESSPKGKERSSWSSLLNCGLFFPLIQELSDGPLESISMSDDDIDPNDLNGASLVKVFNASQEFGQRQSSNRSSGLMSLGDSFFNDLALDVKFSNDCTL